MRVILTGSPLAAPERRDTLYRQLLDRVAAVPGVESASAINHLPLAGDLWTLSFTVAGRAVPPPSEMPGAVFRVVFPDYFRTMRIPLVRGRDFTLRDDARAPGVTIINQSIARRYWPDEDPVGKRIRFGGDRPFTVVGVVKDVEQRDWGAAAGNEFYFSQMQDPENIQSYITLVARAAGDPLALAGAIEREVWSFDRDLPISDVLSMEQVVDRAVWQPRFSATLLGGFGALALMLAAVGIYGVISFDVSRRTREIGIRMALGAKPAQVMGQVLGGGARIAVVGTVAGMAGAMALTRYMVSMLYEVGTTDPATLAAAALVLGGVAMGAVWIPARRATRTDPVAALRSE